MLDMKINCAYTDLVDIDKIVPHNKNPNKHSLRQVDMLAKIINFAGQRLPLIVSKRSGFLICGHGRLMALKKLGFEKVAVDYQDFENEAAEYQHMVADNAIAELAETDHEMLLEIGTELGPDFDSELLGLDVDLHVEVDAPEVHEGTENAQIVILECPHCKESFEKSHAKIIG
jgi:hypothetical protein